MNQNQDPFSWNSFIHAELTYRVCLLPKHKVSLNYSQIRAWDSSAYPSVSTQGDLLMCKSLRPDVRSEVCVTTIHDKAL